MTDLITRPRRLRQSAALRALFEETTLSLNDLVLPIFVEEEIDDYKAIEAMPGVMRIPEKYLAREIERIANAGIRSVMTFGISHHTDATGSDTWNENGLVARMSRICKSTVPEMIVMSDTCFCEYTSHGHCGVLCDHGVDNDATLENLGKQAVVAAAAGADFIAPSAAMDGQVQAIRRSLDAAGFTNTAIMSYSTKFASSFYGPFREAAGTALKGDRKTYQMSPMNRREAIISPSIWPRKRSSVKPAPPRWRCAYRGYQTSSPVRCIYRDHHTVARIRRLRRYPGTGANQYL